jgi:DNA-binding XRE family transcriptional regulator
MVAADQVVADAPPRQALRGLRTAHLDWRRRLHLFGQVLQRVAAILMHEYITILRRMLLAKFTYEQNRLRLEGPRTGILLKLVREATGLTQRGLADKLGVHHTYLSKIANGKVEAGFPVLEKLYYLWEETQPLEVLPLPERMSHPTEATPESSRGGGQ